MFVVLLMAFIENSVCMNPGLNLRPDLHQQTMYPQPLFEGDLYLGEASFCMRNYSEALASSCFTTLTPIALTTFLAQLHPWHHLLYLYPPSLDIHCPPTLLQRDLWISKLVGCYISIVSMHISSTDVLTWKVTFPMTQVMSGFDTKQHGNSFVWS